MKPGDTIRIREEGEIWIVSDMILDPVYGLGWSKTYPVDAKTHYINDRGVVKSIYEDDEDEDDEEEMF